MLAERVRATIRRYDLLPDGGRVAVALSGGGDSVALLHLLRDCEAGGLSVVGIAHLNHQLREGAAADEAFCRTVASELGLPIVVERIDVAAAAREERRSIEDAGRRLRYAFLERARTGLRADAVAVGHTLDDQAETFLLRVLRGAGTRGLGGIRPRRGRIVRPLIDIRRAELRQFLDDRCLTYQEDTTNAEVGPRRNRIRHELIPYLQGTFGEGVVEVLAREADLARIDDDRLQNEAIELLDSLVLTDTAREAVTVDAVGLTSLHPALSSRVARQALEILAGGRFLGFAHVTRLVELASRGVPGQSARFPGQVGRVVAGGEDRIGASIVLKAADAGRRPRRRGAKTGANGTRE